jgi:methyltransferase-like protein/cyclopropane fatty-acyl-phospholipid synthase-like methyltransferase
MSISISLPSSDNTYDEVPYESYPYQQSHPNALATIAALFNMEATPPETSRILELGCAAGGNIIPLAIAYPKAEIVGVDLSRVQIELANQQIKDLKLNNIKFHHSSITDIDDSYGKFDYIIAHGIISWVPEFVRQKMFDICGQLLTEKGIAYISYNAFPGWNTIKSIRDMMLFHSANFANISDKLQQAKLFLEFVKEALNNSETPYSQIIKQEAQLIAGQRDSYIRHDHMEEENHPYYLHKFVEEAEKRGLQYLGDTSVPSMYLGNMSASVIEKLSQVKDVVRTEQYMDFITNRRFRSTLLCRKSVALNRSLNAEDIKKFYLTSNLTPEVSFDAVLNLEDFTQTLKFYFNNSKENALSTSSSIMKAILYTFAENTLTPLKLDQITKIANEKLPNAKRVDIKQELINNAMKLVFSGHITISTEVFDCADKIDNKPVLYKLARYQAEHTSAMWVTNTKSQAVFVNIFDKYAFRYMDGKHTKEEIMDLVIDNHILKGEITVTKDSKKLEDRNDIKAEVIGIIDQTLNNALKGALFVHASSKSK